MTNTSKSFSTRLSLNILLIVSALFVVATIITAVTSHLMIADEATKSAKNNLQAAINDIEKSLQSVEDITQNASWLIGENKDDIDYLYHITSRSVKSNPHIIGSAIAFIPYYHSKDQYYFSPYSYIDFFTDEIGTTQLGTDDYNYFEMEWFKVPFETGKPHWTEPYFDEGGGEQLMSTYSYPLKDSLGNVYAVATADISLEWLSERVENIKPYPHSYITLASGEGRYLSGWKQYDLFKETILTTAHNIKDPRAIQLCMEMMDGKSGTIRFRNNGQTSFAVYGPLSNGWSAALVCQYRDVLARTTQMHIVLILVGLIGLLLIFITCRRSIRHLTMPLTELSVSALNMAKGNFQTTLPEINSQDEMKRLRDSFAYMQKSLTRYIAELKSTTAANERMEGELNIARKIQMGMLPKDFRENIYALLYPAKQIGGDLYDFFENDGKLFFAIGDVSGKGVPAALVMAITRAAFRFITNMGLPLNQVIYHINNSIANNNENCMFVTMFAGCIDLTTGDFKYCNAGHNPIIIIPADGTAHYLDAKTNMAVGVFEGYDYRLEESKLENGSRLLLYTDGVTEAEDIDEKQYGEERLLNITNKLKNEDAENAVKSIYESVKDFTQGNQQNDDITILGIEVKLKSQSDNQ